MKFSRRQLWQFYMFSGKELTYQRFRDDLRCEAQRCLLNQHEFDYLNRCEKNSDIKYILVSTRIYLSENHPGGDDIISLVDDIVKAIRSGYKIATWYGPGGEAMIIGFRPKIQIK